MTQTVFYARVSTADQSLDHQINQAKASGYTIDHVVSDHGVSGVSTALSERPEGKRLFDMLRKGDTLVIRWVDRLGRNYTDVTDTIRLFIRQGVTVRTVINGLTFDGTPSDPMQEAVRDALIAFMAATAQAQAEATKEAQRAGIEAAKAKPDRYRGGKPTYDRTKMETVQDQLATGATVSATARDTGLTRQTILRIRDKPEHAEAALARWGM
ncbi:MAG: recombinase family protein [Tateyamaria sp.]|uniref:recombinase family protein n=1 Tax=Alphaproteobacteria TaxID=28211 RepID=UPI003293A76C